MPANGVDTNKKVLNGEGLVTYTGLLKQTLDGITNTFGNDLHNAVTTLIGDATENGNTLGKLEDRVETNEGLLVNLTGSTVGVGTKRLQNPVIITVPAGSFISQLTQNNNGDIAAVTTKIPTATTTKEGLVTLATNATTSTVYDVPQVNAITTDIGNRITNLTTTYKQLQAAVPNPNANGSSYSFINSAIQNEQGVVSVTAATLPTASQSAKGIVQMASGATTAVVYDTVQIEVIKQELLDAVSAGFNTLIVQQLPTENIDINTIYFVPHNPDSPEDGYDEYLYVENGSQGYGWEIIGTTQLSLDTLNDSEIVAIWHDTPAAN